MKAEQFQPPEANSVFNPPKKKFSVFWWIGAVVLLLVILFFVQLLGPSPKIIVSKQTTYVTSPLLPNGLPNYEEYLRQQLRDGVTAENNAAVLLFQALGKDELKDDQAEQVAAELGLDQVPSSDSVLQNMYGTAVSDRVTAWLKPQFIKPDGSGVTPDAIEVIDSTTSHPWKSEQLPAMAEWIDANQKPLDMIVEASRRPRYYWPSPELLDGNPDSLVTAGLPTIQAIRGCARSLKSRAMRNIGEGRLPEAWQDILALYRLSALMSHNSMLVEQLVAMAIRGIANHGTEVLLSSPAMTKELAHQIRDDLAAVPPFATIADSIDRFERIYTIDSVLQAKTGGFNRLSEPGSNTVSPVDIAAIDWNIVLTKVNTTFDDLVAAMQRPDSQERARDINDLKLQIQSEQDQIHHPANLAAALFSRNARSALVGKVMVSMLLPAIHAVNEADERTKATFALTQLAAAIAESRAEHGKYPARLEDLAPNILSELPTDVYHSKPYIYRRIDDGYLLYTAGSNGNDDGGSNETMNVFEGQDTEQMEFGAEDAEGPQIPSGADDLSIRLPMPKFKLPKPTATE